MAKEWPTIITSLTRSCNVVQYVICSKFNKWHKMASEDSIKRNTIVDWSGGIISSRAFSSVQLLSHVRLLWNHTSLHARPPCPSPSPGVHPNSCPSSDGDAIQPSYPLLSPSPPTLSFFQHKGLFRWVSFSHQVVKILEFQLQHQSFQWIFRTDLL